MGYNRNFTNIYLIELKVNIIVICEVKNENQDMNLKCIIGRFQKLLIFYNFTFKKFFTIYEKNN